MGSDAERGKGKKYQVKREAKIACSPSGVELFETLDEVRETPENTRTEDMVKREATNA